MDYAKPSDIVSSMIDASVKKLAQTPRHLLIRGAISGALLGAATSLAFGAAVTTGQPLGAKVSLYDWWVWNQIPATLGNVVGGFVFTGLALYATYRPAQRQVQAATVASQGAE